MKFPLGRILISLSALVAAVGAYVADWNETHIFNKRWPPHAKFHNAQTMLLGTCLGLATLYFLWSRRWRGLRGVEVGTILASIYWLTQVGAFFFPGTALVDPEFASRLPVLFGVLPFNQLVLDVIFLSVVAVGVVLARREFASAPGV